MQSLFKRVIVFVLILFASTGSSYAQEIRLAELPLPKGTYTGILTGVTQDPKGYMWFATSATGFFSYDGYKIHLYDHQPRDKNSVALNRIEAIAADSALNIWVGTFGKGLNKFDPVTGKFTLYSHDPANSSSLINDSIMVIIQDRAGKMLWIGTRGGLDRFDPETGKFVHYTNDVKNPTSLSHNVVRSVYEDRQGTIWAGTGSSFNGDGTSSGEGGLNKLDQKTGKFTRYMNDPKNPRTLIDNRVRAIFEDSHGTFWIGTAGDGLHTMNRASGTFERHLYDPGKPEKLSRPPVIDLKGFEYVSDHITFINEDATGSIWIGTLESGLNKWDPRTKKIEYFKDFNFGWWAFASHEGVLWMTTFTSITFNTGEDSEPMGPNLSSPIQASLAGNLYTVEPFRKKISYTSLNTPVNSIYQESPAIFWIGTQDSGLIRHDRTETTQQKFKFSGWNEQALSGNNSINILRANREGNIWLGTNTGVELFNKKTQTFTRYNHRTGNRSSMENYRVSSLYVDKEANLWIGSQTGLDYLNTKTNNIIHYHYGSKGAENPGTYHIVSIIEDQEKRLWVGTYYNGLYLLNRKTGKLKQYLFGITITSSMYQDTEGTIWVGTRNGLYRYNAASDQFASFNDPNSGASIGAVLNITEDASKNIWVVTGNELIKFNLKKNEVTRFGKSQGIHPNSMSYGDIGSGGTGHDLYFGNQSGYYVLQPEQLSVNTQPPKILVTEFRISDKLVEAGNNSPLRQPLWRTDDIMLKYNQNNFSFDFLAMHYSNPKDNRVIYMLENYDVGWRAPGVGQKAYYFNVPPGKYIFKVKATNGNGFWSEKNIKIHMTPPWWRAWWVYVISGLLFIGAVWGFIYYRSQKLRSENRVLEENVAHRTAELEKSLADLQSTQAQLIQSEKMASLGELTAGIAHEIQNPLNFVNNFSDVNKELLAEMREEISKGNYDEAIALAKDVADNEEKINHHGKRADAIVKGMLQHSRSNTGVKEPTDINKLADEYLRLAYHGLRAKDKSFNATIKTDYNETVGAINVIPQDVGRAILNLITNAFYAVAEKKKQLPAGYDPTVSVSTKKLNGNVEIKVSDNGNGISKKVLDKIFQPFFTTKPSGQGTGLGLSLTYDIVQAHGGSIKVDSKPGEGTEFVVVLPQSASNAAVEKIPKSVAP